MLFQGQNFRVIRHAKNRYEFRSPYSITYGTATEIAKLITDQTAYAQQSELELGKARRAVLLSALADGVAITKEVPPKEPAPEPEPATVSSPPAPPPARPASPAPKRRRSHVAVVENVTTTSPSDPAKRKPRRYGRAYFNALREREEQETRDKHG